MRIVTVILFLVLCIADLWADVPVEITYQGRMREYGQPVTGVRSMRFGIYDAATNGSQKWVSNDVNVSVSSGVFTYTLTPTTIDWRGKDYWIETVISGKILSPREKITAQAYALHSQTAEDIRKSPGQSVNFTIGNDTRATLTPAGEFSTLLNGTSYYMVPRGAIIMWSGTIATIPIGWALCDGTNGTPDLQNRFILGVPIGQDPGITGGTSLHAHTIVSHTHGMGNHTHAYSGATGAQIQGPAGFCDDSGGTYLSGTNHTHSCNGTSNGPSTNTTDGSEQLTTSNISNLPPYYTLAFIIKL